MITGLTPLVRGVGSTGSLIGAVNGPSVLPNGCVKRCVLAHVVTAEGAHGTMIAASPVRTDVEWL